MTVEGQMASNNRADSISVPGPKQGLCNPLLWEDFLVWGMGSYILGVDPYFHLYPEP